MTTHQPTFLDGLVVGCRCGWPIDPATINEVRVDAVCQHIGAVAALEERARLATYLEQVVAIGTTATAQVTDEQRATVRPWLDAYNDRNRDLWTDHAATAATWLRDSMLALAGFEAR
jgi:ribulose kinase